MSNNSEFHSKYIIHTRTTYISPTMKLHKHQSNLFSHISVSRECCDATVSFLITAPNYIVFGTAITLEQIVINCLLTKRYRFMA